MQAMDDYGAHPGHAPARRGACWEEGRWDGCKKRIVRLYVFVVVGLSMYLFMCSLPISLCVLNWGDEQEVEVVLTATIDAMTADALNTGREVRGELAFYMKLHGLMSWY